ncbi:MAG: GNAT family N-acetyltransferase [Pseudomonadota bacterium]
MEVRDATAEEIPALAALWFDGWHDSHADIVPLELTQVRTLESFMRRLQAVLANIRVVGAEGAPLGFSVLKDDELYQLFVSAEARGSGVATALIQDAESRLAQSGVTTAWLACAIGNDRAARFYEKSGWTRVRTQLLELETEKGGFELNIWRYEKALSVPWPP